MNKIYDYSELTLTQLIEKISTSRFFMLPKMVAEALKKLNTTDEPKYKVYTALLSQSGTDAPTAIVLENTLGGDIIWTRTGIGAYVGEIQDVTMDSGIFWCNLNGIMSVNRGLPYYNRFFDILFEENSFGITLRSTDDPSATVESTIDETFVNIPLEIRIYN